MYALPATGDRPAPEIEDLAARAADAAAAIAAAVLSSYRDRMAAIVRTLDENLAEAMQATDPERPYAPTEPYLGHFGLQLDEEAAACAQLLAREAALLARVYRHRAGRGPGREFILGDADLPPALQAEREALGDAFTFLESGGGARG